MNRYSHIHAICQDGSLYWNLSRIEGENTWSTRVAYSATIKEPTDQSLRALTKKHFSLSTEEDKLVKVTIVETKK